MSDTCEACRYFNLEGARMGLEVGGVEPVEWWGYCRRSPRQEDKAVGDWCGEYDSIKCSTPMETKARLAAISKLQKEHRERFAKLQIKRREAARK